MDGTGDPWRPERAWGDAALAAARAGFIEGVRQSDLGDTGLWVRVNCLNSPWILDDLAQTAHAPHS